MGASPSLPLPPWSHPSPSSLTSLSATPSPLTVPGASQSPLTSPGASLSLPSLSLSLTAAAAPTQSLNISGLQSPGKPNDPFYAPPCVSLPAPPPTATLTAFPTPSTPIYIPGYMPGVLGGHGIYASDAAGAGAAPGVFGVFAGVWDHVVMGFGFGGWMAEYLGWVVTVPGVAFADLVAGLRYPISLIVKTPPWRRGNQTPPPPPALNNATKNLLRFGCVIFVACAISTLVALSTTLSAGFWTEIRRLGRKDLLAVGFGVLLPPTAVLAGLAGVAGVAVLLSWLRGRGRGEVGEAKRDLVGGHGNSLAILIAQDWADARRVVEEKEVGRGLSGEGTEVAELAGDCALEEGGVIGLAI